MTFTGPPGRYNFTGAWRLGKTLHVTPAANDLNAACCLNAPAVNLRV
jgi:hypothetical protein